MKRDHGKFDFSDMEQLCWQVLQDEQVRASVQGSYDYLFIDECQDVSRIQDSIIRNVQGPKTSLFLVGDVKQSIYRFRRADPTLMIAGIDRIEAGAPDSRVIYLRKNFRSSPTVLDACNRVFRRVMHRSVAEIDYTKNDELDPGRTDAVPVPTEILLVDTPRRKDASLRREAEAAAERIHQLMDEGFHARDIVILMPKVSGNARPVCDVLENHGIRTFFDGGDSFITMPEIVSFIAILQTVDDMLQDIPLLATLKLPPFSLTDSDLADIRLSYPDKDSPFHQAFLHCA